MRKPRACFGNEVVGNPRLAEIPCDLDNLSPALCAIGRRLVETRREGAAGESEPRTRGRKAQGKGAANATARAGDENTRRLAHSVLAMISRMISLEPP